MPEPRSAPGRDLTPALEREARLGAARLLLAVGVILVLALAIPPAVALGVHHARLRRAATDVAGIAKAVTEYRLNHGEWPVRDLLAGGVAGPPIDVLIGPGTPPREVAGSEWHKGRLSPLDVLTGARVTPDPWGNHYLVNIRFARGQLGGEPTAKAKAVWALSAGPNGIIETAFEQDAARAVLGGDDAGVRIR